MIEQLKKIKSYRKGIILAGGKGSRLYPLTKAVSKQLLPIYDKPMIFYPISTLMSIGIKDILIITTPHDQESFKKLLGDGTKWGVNFEFKVQSSPDGIVQAFIIGRNFLKDSKSVLILGDNLFHGSSLSNTFAEAGQLDKGATVFAYPVKDPERYGVLNFNQEGLVLDIEEKPKNPKTNYAITGIYFYDETVVEKSLKVKQSNRGEYEITDLNNMYLKEKSLHVEILGRGTAWLDTGNHDSLHEASGYIKTLENRQGLKIGCPEEIAWRNGWISDNALEKLSVDLSSSGYGNYLLNLINKNG